MGNDGAGRTIDAEPLGVHGPRERCDLPDAPDVDWRAAERPSWQLTDGRDDWQQQAHEMLATLGNELRCPLAALTEGIELVGRLAESPERIEELSSMLTSQVERMKATLDQLLDAERAILGKLVLARDAVDVSDIARFAVETVRPMVDFARQELAVDLPPPATALVDGDAFRLVQVLENLLVNASKYTRNGGRIWLEVSLTDDTVRVCVRDTGVGMDPLLLRRAFDALVQGPQGPEHTRGGMGLGLPLVRRLVKMHGGQVEARSEGPGRGSAFVVTLPRRRTDRSGRRRAGPARRRALPRRRILVFEHEADTAAALAELLALEEQAVEIVHDGHQALQSAAQFQPDVVLLDLALPGVDGYTVGAKLRAELDEATLLVAITGCSEDGERMRRAGFDGQLLKPIELSRLLDLLARGS